MIYLYLKTHKKQPYNIKKVIYQDRKSKKQASITKSNWRKFSFLASIYLFMQYHIVFLCLIGFFNCNNFHWELLLYSLLHHGTWWEWWSPNPTTSPPMIMRKQGPFGKWFFPDNDSFVENNQPWFVDGAILNCASGSASFILFFFKNFISQGTEFRICEENNNNNYHYFMIPVTQTASLSDEHSTLIWMQFQLVRVSSSWDFIFTYIYTLITSWSLKIIEMNQISIVRKLIYLARQH